MNEYIYNKEYITNIKKSVINYISRTNINVNKIAFNLSLYNDFIIDGDDTTIKTTLPKIENRKITPAKVVIGGGYFNIVRDTYYIKPDYEDILTNKITRILVSAASIKVKYENMAPISIEGVGVRTNTGDGIDYAISEIISEEINNYITPNFDDDYSFNKGIMRMISAICGYKNILSTYFNHDKSLCVAMYSLSVDANIFDKINTKMTLIKHLINTLRTEKYKNEEVLRKLIDAKKFSLINSVINKLYIPFINSVPLDKRKIVRDEILKGFLGSNYINLKLTKENKESYYYASLINNTVPINNKVTEQSWAYFREQVATQNATRMNEIYSIYSKYNAKNDIREFWVIKNGNDIYIKTSKKDVLEKKLVLEMLSYAYINSIDENLKQKIEDGIIKLCSLNDTFTSSLNGNPLSNYMLTAAIIRLASKNGFTVELIGITNNVAKFVVKKREL